MKKILLALLTLISISCFSQTTGYLRYDSVRIMKQGGNSNLIIENATRDSLGFLYNYGSGRTRFEVIRAVPGGIKVGEDTIQVAVNGADEIISGLSVSWKGSGYQFYVQEGVYRIDNVIYTSDSGSLTLAASDPTDPRKDVIYVGTDGAFHVLQGTPSPGAAEPQLDGDQIKVTVIDVPAGSTVPAFTQEIIYNENIEWTETHTSVTVDPNSATTPWIGAKNFNVTNINNGDQINFTKPLGTVSVLNYTAFSIAIKLKAILPTTSTIRVAFFSSTIQVSNVININLNKNSLVYQVVSVPLSAFTFSNYNVDRVRISYTNTAGATVHTGFYMDYIHLIAGITQPGGGGDFNATLVMPSGFQVSPPTIQNNGTFNVTGAGSTSQYIDGTGALRTFTAWNTQGAIDGVAKTAFGFGVNGNIFHQQYADATYPGIASAYDWRRFDSAARRTVTNGPNDTLAAYVDDFTTLIKGLKDSTGIGFVVYDDYISIYATGGGGGGGEKFGVTGEDNVAAETREFTSNGHPFSIVTDNNDLFIRNEDIGVFINEIGMRGNGNAYMRGEYTSGGNSQVSVGFGKVILWSDSQQFTVDSLADVTGFPDDMKVVVWHEPTKSLYRADYSEFGGGGGVSDGDKGDITVSSSGTVWTVDNLAITNAKINDVAWSKIASTPTTLGGYGITDGVNAVGAVGAAPNAEGASISGHTLTLQPASATTPGVMTAIGQTLGGVKNWQDQQRFLTELRIANITAPGSPLAGTGYLYPKTSDKKLYWKDDTGTEYDLTSGGPGGGPSGGGLFPVTGTGTATGAVIGDLDGNTFNINNGANVLLFFDVASFSSQLNASDGDDVARLTLLGDSGGGSIKFSLSADPDAGSTVEIEGDAVANTITHTADSHIFNGPLTLNGSTSGSVIINSDALGNSLRGTTLTGQGVIPSATYSVLQSAHTLTDNSTEQAALPSGQDVWTLQASTLYEFEAFYDLSSGNTSHTTATGFVLGGGASINWIKYDAVSYGAAINVSTNALRYVVADAATATVINAANTNTRTYIRVKGVVSINAGGTFQPTIKFSTTTSGTTEMGIGSYFKLNPIGINSTTIIGPIN